MRFRRRNWQGETGRQNHERRIEALEIHIQDLEGRLNERVSYLMTRIPPLPDPLPTDEDMGL